MKAGLNLFSIRNFIKTEEDFLDTAIKLREMGYSTMQYSGGEFVPERIARVSKASGLPVVVTHVPYDRIVNDAEALMAEHDMFDCKCIGLGALNSQLLLKPDELKMCIEKLNKSAELMKKKGFRFCYHHHSFEFFKIDGETVFDYMLKNSPSIDFTIDTYWLQYGGVDILKTIEKAGSRMAFIHLKDYKIEAQLKEDGSAYRFNPIFAPVGEGNIDFKSVTELCRNIGMENFLVEQDNAALLPDTLDEVRRSIEYIRNEL